jgi:hypothetical protein
VQSQYKLNVTIHLSETVWQENQENLKVLGHERTMSFSVVKDSSIE